MIEARYVVFRGEVVRVNVARQTRREIHFAAIITVGASSSCSSPRSGAGGYATGMGVDARGTSYNSYDLVPVGDRITYTIDISTPEGRQKLQGISLPDAQRLAETEASRKFNCDRLIDPRSTI